uniref:Uncharacterized protein n=1 Tax=Chromera velia CCMP2878 TaxID=1169474 RepID=A0A0G4GZL0_9ALVE|eukprot:Cvel_24051.t1-p1 / transcript=Cvel_24051.t1 / gene=Cvel_24051 / organism=Chromera_velia_CCMP2878 / gene_product=hypothetical protein / transcript_product=hypothetical protein / location=Cvel_scaffold2558:480-1472(-) / protein_length=331 / sequence_SO=supercontig / SO=protein_coding / is_pseudo=false
MTYKHPHPDAVLRPFTNYLQPCRQVQFIPISGGKSAELQRQGLRGVETVGRITEPEFPQAEVPNEVWSAVNETPKEQKKQKVLETFHFFEKEETSNNFASLSPGEVLDVHLDGVRDGATTEAIARLSLLTPEAVSDLCLSPGRCLGNVPRLQRLLQLISLLPSCTKIRAMMVEGMKRRVCDLKPVEITHSSLRSLSLKHATQIGETLGHLGGTEAAAFVNSALVGSVGGEALYLMTSLAVSFLKNLPVPAVRSPQVTPLLRTAKALEQSKNLRLRIKMPITSFFAEVEVVMLYSEDWPESRAVRDSIVKGTPDFKQVRVPVDFDVFVGGYD